MLTLIVNSIHCSRKIEFNKQPTVKQTKLCIMIDLIRAH